MFYMYNTTLALLTLFKSYKHVKLYIELYIECTWGSKGQDPFVLQANDLFKGF